MNVSKITIARLYNLGSYEHMRYEITVDVPPGESACDALTGLERILRGLKPESQSGVKTELELEHGTNHVADLRAELVKNGDAEFTRRHGHFVGTPDDYITRCEVSLADDIQKRIKYKNRAKRARRALDAVGGAAQWKDAKLDWEDNDTEF